MAGRPSLLPPTTPPIGFGKWAGGEKKLECVSSEYWNIGGARPRLGPAALSLLLSPIQILAIISTPLVWVPWQEGA